MAAPPNKLSRTLELGHGELWEALRSLLGHLEDAVDRDAFLIDCLDHLVDLIDADRGLVVLVDEDGGEQTIVRARGPRGDLSEQEQREISATLIEAALREGEPKMWSGEQQPSTASMVRFGIWIAVAIPLRAAGAPLGVLYIDLRKPTKFLAARHREFIDAAAVLTAVVLRLSQRLEATQSRLEQAHARPAESRHLPSLESLLRSSLPCSPPPSSPVAWPPSTKGRATSRPSARKSPSCARA